MQYIKIVLQQLRVLKLCKAHENQYWRAKELMYFNLVIETTNITSGTKYHPLNVFFLGMCLLLREKEIEMLSSEWYPHHKLLVFLTCVYLNGLQYNLMKLLSLSHSRNSCPEKLGSLQKQKRFLEQAEEKYEQSYGHFNEKNPSVLWHFLPILHFCKSFQKQIFVCVCVCVLKWQNIKHGKLKGELEVHAQSRSYGATGITEM